LIKYLEELTKSCFHNRKEAGEFKDYTALLLNCYVKMKMHDKIKELTQNMEKNSAFDMNTVIDICRQQPETLD